MTDVWLASVNCDGITLLDGPMPQTPFTGFVALAARLFVANDGTNAGSSFPFSSQFGFAILAGIQDNFTGGTPAYEYQSYYRFLQKPAPTNPFNDWFDVFRPTGPGSWTANTLVEASGNNGASFFSGGTLSIQKDFGSRQFVFTTPLGSVAVPFAWLMNQPTTEFLSWTPTDTPLMAVGIGHALAYPDDTITNQETTKWFDFFTRKNGNIVAGAPLSALQPGFWNPPFTSHWLSPPGGGNYHLTSVLIPSTDGQEASRYRSQLSAAPLPAQVYDATTEQRYIGTGSFAFFGLDVTNEEQRNLSFGAWIPGPLYNAVKIRQSSDDGQSWTEATALSGNDLLTAVSIQLFAGGIYVLYQDSITAAINQISSLDGALTWSLPMPVAIIGTNPRLVISPEGAFFYFYLDNSANLVLRRSFDVGATLFDASAIIVAASVPVQDFAAVMTGDRALVVAYADAGSNWISRLSRDYGLTWGPA